jgi:hypothetical protein
VHSRLTREQPESALQAVTRFPTGFPGANAVESNSEQQVGASSGEGFGFGYNAERPLFALPSPGPTGINAQLSRGMNAPDGTLVGDMQQRASAQGDVGGLLDAQRGRPIAPQMHPQTLPGAARNQAAEVAARPEPVHVAQEIEGAKDVERRRVDGANTRSAVAGWGQARGVPADPAGGTVTETEEADHRAKVAHALQTAEATRAAAAAVAAMEAAAKTAMEATKLARRAEKACAARLRFAFARWWAHSRMHAYERHEGRITQSRAGAAPTPGIIPFNAYAGTPGTPPLMYTSSVLPAMLSTVGL